MEIQICLNMVINSMCYTIIDTEFAIYMQREDSLRDAAVHILHDSLHLLVIGFYGFTMLAICLNFAQVC